MDPRNRIVLSVTDKTGIEKWGALSPTHQLVSTGGTARLLREKGVECTLVEDITEFPEMFDGRLKTLHPKVHGGILADRDKTEHLLALARYSIVPVDFAVVNFYDFKKNKCLEEIDIGGPTMLRAAAKNCKHVLPVIDPDDYDLVIERVKSGEGFTPAERCSFALKVFEHTAEYDAAVAQWMKGQLGACRSLY